MQNTGGRSTQGAAAAGGDHGTPRSPLLPTESVTVYSWQAVALPKGTPPDNRGIVAALNDRQVRQPLLDVGLKIVATTPPIASLSPPTSPSHGQ